MTTKVVNIHKDKHDVYIGRAGKGQDGYFGNPFKVGQDGSREYVLEMYREYFKMRMEEDSVFRQRILELKDKTLGCFCKPQTCHGDVIAEYLNSIQT